MSDDYLSKPLSFGAPSPALPSQQIQTLSPYLNYDSRYLQAQPEFIFPEGASKQRGRFELAFSQIGSSAMIGAGIGGMAGLYNGMRATALANQTGKLRRTQLLNHVMKQGAGTANTLGTIAVMYSAFGVFLQWARGEDDEINTIAAGGATGLLYKSTAGLRKCAVGCGIGLALSSLYVLWGITGGSSKKLKELRSQYL
ncbi:mitochondrial import inner membrane translocase subunit Tim23-like [Sabethes cyaneus]|uniref:mitochondrial import inner membrane translocase subunit Tim23-like n=1 Tax=Sabethes cyaneus TaxID=53552 RepID=UPI00221E2A7D|nr:mitochondrial import inner membrane translocase subunit Tim23-like [Sabethes cyaneus]